MPSNSVSDVALLLGAPAATSPTNTVPAGVPFVLQTSRPVVPSSAVKNNVPPTPVSSCGDDPAPKPTVPAWAKVAPEQIAEAQKHGVPVAFENELGMRFVLIPAGNFLMGSPEDEAGRQDDETQHEVTISRGFWLGEYEITQGQWESAMGTTPWSGLYNLQEDPSHPAIYISWEHVDELTARLNEHEGAEVYRLPTEAEWEYACRAGTTARWSFGDSLSDLKDYAWYLVNAANVGLMYAQPVGTRLGNPWGLFDMTGNVWEWTSDWYDAEYYQYSPVDDPKGPASGTHHVKRGGCLHDNDRFNRIAFRIGDAPSYRKGPHLGFRVVAE